MVESGHTSISEVEYASRLHPQLPVEVVTRSELIGRVDSAHLVAPQRPSFYLLVLMRSGRGSHVVDFKEIPARPGRLIQIRPGQVQSWNLEVDFDATVVLAQPTTLSSHPWFPGHSSFSDLDMAGTATADALIGALRRQQGGFEGDGPTVRLMTALFAALVALFDQAQSENGPNEQSEVYLAFRHAIETDLGYRHDVTDYARHLGYSARTITRACQKATGRTAKRVLIDRLVLEAKRLLVHTDDSAAVISAELGFSEPTNFAKFFSRNTAHSPTDFRRLYR